MSRFGVSEIIRPLSMTRVVAEKDTYFGGAGARVEKVADSHKPEGEQATLAEIIKAIKHIYAGNSDYTCIELFTDKSGKGKTGVDHMSICHMKRTK